MNAKCATLLTERVPVAQIHKIYSYNVEEKEALNPRPSPITVKQIRKGPSTTISCINQFLDQSSVSRVHCPCPDSVFGGLSLASRGCSMHVTFLLTAQLMESESWYAAPPYRPSSTVPFWMGRFSFARRRLLSLVIAASGARRHLSIDDQSGNRFFFFSFVHANEKERNCRPNTFWDSVQPNRAAQLIGSFEEAMKQNRGVIKTL